MKTALWFSVCVFGWGVAVLHDTMTWRKGLGIVLAVSAVILLAAER